MIAIIPAAGRGTRMLSVTGGRPKELLKLGSSTILERIIDEAFEADADRVVVVSSPDKPEIDRVAIEAGAEIIHQPVMRGMADAIARVNTDSDVLVLLGDCAYHGTPPSYRMANLVLMGIDGAIAVETVTEDELSKYGIAEIDAMGSILSIKEKPKPSETASRYAVAGRYAFSGRFMAFLRDYVSARLSTVPGEIGGTEVIAAALELGMDFKAVALQPNQRRIDCGSPEEYAAARALDWD